MSNEQEQIEFLDDKIREAELELTKTDLEHPKDKSDKLYCESSKEIELQNNLKELYAR